MDIDNLCIVIIYAIIRRKPHREKASKIPRDIFFFFDDSGVLHKNAPAKHFVYAGYVFPDRVTLDDAKRKYINANKKLKQATGRKDELKAATLNPTQKRALFNSVRKFDSVSAVVDIDRVYDHILSSKKAICRFKDYVLKICVKRKLVDMIQCGTLSSSDDIFLHIFIDEQLTATNGYYDLRDSIVEELQYGIINFNYGVSYPPVFTGNVQVEIQYCESKNNYMIQASDILANRIWASYQKGTPDLRCNIPNHSFLTFS